MSLPTKPPLIMSDSPLAPARHRLRPNLAAPSYMPPELHMRSSTQESYYLSDTLSLLPVSLNAGPWPAAAERTVPRTEQVRSGKYAIAVSSFDSPAKPAAAPKQKFLSGLPFARPRGNGNSRARPSRASREEAGR